MCLYVSTNLSQGIELNVTKDEWLVQSEERQLNFFLTVNEEAGESWRYNLRVGNLINNSAMRLAKGNVCSLKGVFLIIICFQSCTEVLYLSLLGEFRGTVTPVVIEMIKLVQGKDVILFILRTVWTEYVFIITLQY